MKLFALLILIYWSYASVRERWEDDIWSGVGIHGLILLAMGFLLYYPAKKPVEEKAAKAKPREPAGDKPPAEAEPFFDEKNRMIIFPKEKEEESTTGCGMVGFSILASIIGLGLTFTEEWMGLGAIMLFGGFIGAVGFSFTAGSFRTTTAMNFHCLGILALLVGGLFFLSELVSRGALVLDALAIAIMGIVVVCFTFERYSAPPDPPDPVIALDELEGEEKKKWEKEAARLLEKQRKQNPTPPEEPPELPS
ncbi:MAG: hypothetical protein AB1705_22620 [Verrucomicrobiota bacterium]